ncbi:MAG: 5-(carboxyamino)imidazole ribonucleotide mutase [Nitrospinota bacterium]|nr:5-(carboxyamino)imidazole ribonucleotide mutase [Nitrospinota bacterium]
MDVLIFLGSASDMEVGEEIVSTLDRFGVSYDLRITSAHRTPEKTRSLVRAAEEKGAKIIICCAGLSAHLAGMVAAESLLPVIGVPLAAGPLNGWDSLMSTVNMPGGVPVATVSLGSKAGGRNGALLAIRIIALSDRVVAEKLREYKVELALSVEEADRKFSKHSDHQ